MAKNDRIFLEGVAVDMMTGAEHIPFADALQQVATFSDSELVDFITA